MNKTSATMVAIMMAAILTGFFVTAKFAAAGETGRDGHFIAYSNGTVLDTRTNLMWAAKDNGSDTDWRNAKSYCTSYRGGGYKNWRLPKQDELAGLYDENKSHPAKCNPEFSINVATELIDISCVDLWASETRGSDSAIFSFTRSRRGWHPRLHDRGFRALPVRFVK